MSQSNFQSQNEKARLRKEVLLQRQSLAVDLVSRQLGEHLMTWKSWGSFSRVLAYSPFRGEADLLPLARHTDSVSWYLPIIQENETMVFAQYLPSEAMSQCLKLGRFGILEPELNGDIIATVQPGDLVLVPGLLFDAYGNRLGYGKGYYDRFFESKLNGQACLVGVSSLPLHRLPLPNDAWDIQMNYLLTPSGIFKKK